MSENENFDLWTEAFSNGKRTRSIRNVCQSTENNPAQSEIKKLKESHRVVEQRRRDRMKLYLTDLETTMSSLNIVNKMKPTKMNLLETATTYVKSLRGDACRKLDEGYKPSFLSDEELKNLISEGARGFLFMVTCDTGLVVYVTDTVARVLNRSEQEWLGSTIYDQVHVNDVEKIKEQLSIEEVPGRILDLKAGAIKKEGTQAATRYWNCRRNFVCRMKVGNNNDCMVSKPLKPANRLGNDDYAVVHCSGYVRNWLGNEEGTVKNFYLIAMGRLEIIPSPSSSSCRCENSAMHTTDISDPFSETEFVLKLLPDERIAFADERITSVLGFLPRELLNKSCFDFSHVDDYLTVKDGFHKAVKLNGQEVTFVCRLKSKSLEWIWIKVVAVAFTNPCSYVMEFVIFTCSNAKLVEIPSNESLQNLSSLNTDSFSQTSNFFNAIQTRDFSLNENNASVIDAFNAISNYD